MIGKYVPRVNKLLGPYAALRSNRNLALLFSGQVVSALGDWLYIATIAALAYTLTGSAMLAAGLTFTRLLPYVLFLPVSGVLADRFDRRRLMITADAGRAICMVGLLLATSRATIWLDFPLVFAATALGSLFRPALRATVPAAAGDATQLVRANALMSQIDALSLLLGPALAGILILLGEARLAFTINAVTYGVSALTLLLLRVPPRSQPARGAEHGWFAELLVGGRFLFGAQAGALGAVVLGSAGLQAFCGACWTLLVALAIQTWHFGSQGSGFLLAAYGVGGLLGGFYVSALARRLRPTVAYVGSLAVSGLAILLLGLSPAGLLPFAVMAGFGSADMLNQVVTTTLIQTSTPDALLGRVFGAFEAVMVSATVLGALATGPLLSWIGPRGTTLALASVTLVMLLAALPRLGVLEGGKRAAGSVAPDAALVPAAS